MMEDTNEVRIVRYLSGEAGSEERSMFEHELEVNYDGSIGLLHEEKLSGVIVNRTFKPGQFSVAPGLLTELFDTVTA